ncbi:MAG: hypothetical protein ACKOEH_10985, partial [Actinomycetota bacterium]
MTAFTALAASVKNEIRETIGASFRGDFALSVNSRGFGGIPTSVTDKIKDLPEVDQATGVGFIAAKVGDESPFILVFDPKTAGGLYEFEMIEGAQTDLGDDEIIFDRFVGLDQD